VKTFIVVASILLLMMVVGVGTCRVCVGSLEYITEKHELTILEHELVKQMYRDGPEVVGQVRNDTGFTLESVEVDVRWYSAGGALLGTSSGYLLDYLPPGEVWEFRVRGACEFDRVADYKIIAEGSRL